VIRKTHGREIAKKLNDNESSPIYLMDSTKMCQAAVTPTTTSTTNGGPNNKRNATSAAAAATNATSKKLKAERLETPDEEQVPDEKNQIALVNPIVALSRTDTRQKLGTFASFDEIKSQLPDQDVERLMEEYRASKSKGRPFATCDDDSDTLWIDKKLLDKDHTNLRLCVPAIVMHTQEYGSDNPIIIENRKTDERLFFPKNTDLILFFPGMFPGGLTAENKRSIRYKFRNQRENQAAKSDCITEMGVLQWKENGVLYYIALESLLLDGSLKFPATGELKHRLPKPFYVIDEANVDEEGNVVAMDKMLDFPTKVAALEYLTGRGLMDRCEFNVLKDKLGRTSNVEVVIPGYTGTDCATHQSNAETVTVSGTPKTDTTKRSTTPTTCTSDTLSDAETETTTSSNAGTQEAKKEGGSSHSFYLISCEKFSQGARPYDCFTKHVVGIDTSKGQTQEQYWDAYAAKPTHFNVQ
jgi:hypothetical protein